MRSPLLAALAVYAALGTMPAVAATLRADSVAAEPHLVAIGAGWNLPRLRRAVHSPLRPVSGSGTYGLHGSGPALAALDAMPSGVTAPSSIDEFTLKYHSGPIQPTTTSYVIYWDPPGAIMDRFYQKLIDRFLTDTAGSAIYAMLTQYTGSNGTVAANSTFGGSLVDKDKIPKPLTEAEILNEVANVLAQFNFTPNIGDEVFLVFPHGALPANGYCAYHGGFTYGNNQLTLALIPYADVPGCGEDYDFQTPNFDLIADGGVAEVSTAQVGMITDPLLNAWYDDKHGEVGDLCFEDFGDGVNGLGADLIIPVKSGTHSYEVPEAYSNAVPGCAPAL